MLIKSLLFQQSVCQRRETCNEKSGFGEFVLVKQHDKMKSLMYPKIMYRNIECKESNRVGEEVAIDCIFSQQAMSCSPNLAVCSEVCQDG